MENLGIERLQAAVEAAERRAGLQPDRRERPAGLRFESPLEQGYLRHRAESVLLLQRLAVALGAVFYAIYLGYDYLNEQRYAEPWLWLVLGIFNLPFNAALFAATFGRDPWRHTTQLATLAAVMNSIGMVTVSAMGTSMGKHAPFEMILVQLMYDFFLLGLPWGRATLIAGLTVTLGPLTLAQAGLSGTDLFDYSFFVIIPAILGSMGCYLAERAQRLAWLRAQLLRELSEHDPLTGLNNHRVFYERGELLLRQARREQKGVAILACDVDHFKQFNDRHGHLAGDECLRRVAKAVRANARRPLDLAARLGGEEFALFLYDTSAEAARSRAEELRATIRGLNLPADVHVSASVGVSWAAADRISSIEALVGQADGALYRAKEAGRNRVSD